jgi:hypothetical protein
MQPDVGAGNNGFAGERMIWRLVDSAAMNGYFSDASQRVEHKGYKLLLADPIMLYCSGSDLLR